MEQNLCGKGPKTRFEDIIVKIMILYHHLVEVQTRKKKATDRKGWSFRYEMGKLQEV